jgi:catechol 2,3-dioxygenase-like lactoylglutathione lyase family enzyme
VPTGLSGWTSVAVGVRSLDAALELWVDILGFAVISRVEEGDEGLDRLWGLAPGTVKRQALVGSDQSGFGMLHLIEYAIPGRSVREGAMVHDLLPKNLDIYVDDLHRRFSELKSHGLEFRAERVGEGKAPDGTVFREIQMRSHDDINVVLLELVGQGGSFTERGFAGVGPLIFIVPDAAAEKRFLADVLQLDKLSDNLLTGPEIEKIVGLPAGAGLDASVWGRSNVRLGGLEVIEYQGVRGVDRYPLARPGARGVLFVSYVLEDAGPLIRRARDAGIEVANLGFAKTLVASGELYRIVSPAGFTLEVYDRNAAAEKP